MEQQTPPRTKENVQQEYAQTCTALGDLSYRALCLKQDRELMLKRLRELNEEAVQFLSKEPTDA